MRRCDRTCRILIAGAAGLVVYAALVQRPGFRPSASGPGIEAARTMQRAMKLVADRRSELRIPADALLDPNRTGLVGPEYSDLLTTSGDVEAKRTTTNPDMAGLLVHLLTEAGVARGRTVGVACSGSFPALMIASIAAVRAVGARPVVILSLGASSYGATVARFNLLDIYDVLLRGGICEQPPAAASLGGDRDVGLEFEPGFRDFLVRQIELRGITLLHEPDLEKNVARRVALYEAAGGRIAALINCGGSYASLGTSAAILQLSPGLSTGMALPPRGERGLVQEMASRGVPVIHLLHIKGLVLRYGLLWDPVPLPEPGTFVPTNRERDGMRFRLVSTLYLVLLAILVLWPAARRADPSEFR